MTTTPRKYLKTISILHLGMTLAPLAMAVFFYSTTTLTTNASLDDDIFIYVFPVIGLVGIFAANFMFKIFTKAAVQKETLGKKLAGFQQASLIKYALLEGPAILNLVWFSTTGNLLFLTVAGVLILFLFMQRPTKSKVELALQLKGEHKRQFDRMDDPIALT